MDYNELLLSEGMSSGERYALGLEVTLAQTLIMLLEDGQRQAAALLLDVQDFDVETRQSEYDEYSVTVALFEVEPYLVPRFTDEVKAVLLPVLGDVARRNLATWPGEIEVRRVLPRVTSNWRQRVSEQLTEENPTNQARRSQMVEPRWMEDGLLFTNDGELRMYQALKRVQAAISQEDTFAIFPLPRGRLCEGHVWEPDFLVTYRKRTGLIEVDGPMHATRAAADNSRDRYWRDSGVAHVERIVIEDTRDATELDAWVRGFLRHLANS